MMIGPHRAAILTVLLAAVFVTAPGASAGAQQGGVTPHQDMNAAETEVLVVATVHTQHRRNPNYTYADVVRILEAFQPEAVCVEIRPEDFRQKPYLKEMMLATVWGVERGLDVCGFDWFTGDDRGTRAALEETPEYQAKAQLYDSLMATNPITSAFDERYGDFWSGEFGYDFYNGPEYNRYFAENYRLSLAVYGDNPVNLFYESRNRHMMDNAWEAIQRHPGGRVVLLTGAEHKHYFDRDLAAREGIRVVNFEDLLPLGEGALSPAVRAFLEDEDDLAYYGEGFPADTTAYFRGKITGLLHGPDMDWRPDIIRASDIEKAGKVLARWRSSQPESPELLFDEGWYYFLADDCDTAVKSLSTLTSALDAGEVEDPFVAVYAYRNLGLCQDILGNRAVALRAYARVREMAVGTRMERSLALILRDFETTPYARGRARERYRR